MKWLIVEIGRPVKQDVIKQFAIGDESNVITISIQRAITESEIPKIVSEVYKKIRDISSEEINVVLSGPLALAFQLGQVIGLSHYKINVYQFSAGRYVLVPPITRDLLF